VLVIDCWPDDMKEDIARPYMNDEGFTDSDFAFYSDAELIAAIVRLLPASIKKIRLERTRDPMGGLQKRWASRMAPRRAALVRALDDRYAIVQLSARAR